MPRTWGFLRGDGTPESPVSPSVSSRSDSNHKPRRDLHGNLNSSRTTSSFQNVKHQVLSSSRPLGTSQADAPADLTERLRNLDVSGVSGAPKGLPSASASTYFPFSDGAFQRPSRRGRGMGSMQRASKASSRFAEREQLGARESLAFAGVSLSSLTQPEVGSCSNSLQAPSLVCEEGAPFCSPMALDELDFSTTATLPHDTASQQQQQQCNVLPKEGVETAAQKSRNMQLQTAEAADRGRLGCRYPEKTSHIPLSTRIGRCLDTLTSVCRLSLTVSLVVFGAGSLSLLCYSLFMDIMLQEQQRQAEAAAEAAACRQRHRDNGCETLNPIPPYLRGPCEEWRACLMSVPENHGETTKVAAQVVAQVLNAFFHSLHWRTIVAVTAFLWLMIYAYRALHHSLAVPCTPVPANCTSLTYKLSPLQNTPGGPSCTHAVATQQPLQLFQEQQLLQQLEYEREVLRQQILRGSAPELLLQSLGRQDAIQRELAYVLTRDTTVFQRQQQEPQSFPCCEKGTTEGNLPDIDKTGFLRTLLRSWLFKFLVVLWVAYACVVGILYAVRHHMFQFHWIAGWDDVIMSMT